MGTFSCPARPHCHYGSPHVVVCGLKRSWATLGTPLGLDAIQEAQEICRRTERAMGKMLAKMKLPGRGGGDTKSSDVVSLGSQLADLGIKKKQSSRWQAEAKVPKIKRTSCPLKAWTPRRTRKSGWRH